MIPVGKKGTNGVDRAAPKVQPPPAVKPPPARPAQAAPSQAAPSQAAPAQARPPAPRPRVQPSPAQAAAAKKASQQGSPETQQKRLAATQAAQARADEKAQKAAAPPKPPAPPKAPDPMAKIQAKVAQVQAKVAQAKEQAAKMAAKADAAVAKGKAVAEQVQKATGDAAKAVSGMAGKLPGPLGGLAKGLGGALGKVSDLAGKGAKAADLGALAKQAGLGDVAKGLGIGGKSPADKAKAGIPGAKDGKIPGAGQVADGKAPVPGVAKGEPVPGKGAQPNPPGQGAPPASRQSGQLVKLTLKPEKGDSIEVQFNPAEYVLTKATPWKHHDIQGLNAPLLEFTSGEPTRLEFDLIFDGCEEAKPVRDQTDKIEKLACVHQELHRPPVILMTWGKGLTYKCVLEHYTLRYTAFLETGVPIRAVMTCTFKEFSPREEQLKGNPRHSPDRTKRRIFKEGDTLASIAGREYEDPTQWRLIADANAIDDPMSVQPGTELKIPPLLGR